MTRRRRFDIRQIGGKIVAVAALLFALNAAFFFFFARPKVVEYRALKVTTDPQQLELKKRTTVVELAEKYLRALEQAEVDLKTLRTEILSTRQQRMVDVQLELDRLCQEFNIDLDGVRYDNEILEAEGLERFGMVVPLEGGYRNLRRFLQAVESSPTFFLVEQVDLGQTKGGGVMLQLSITLATYFDAPDEILPPRTRATQGARRG